MFYRTTSIFLGLLAILLLPAVVADDAETVKLVLPHGDPEAGRKAFVALGCISCHRVEGEKGSPVSANPGPTLGRYQGQQGAARLGLSIFAPSHEISATVREREDELSPMPDFTRVMTVRQFLDLIAFLQSQ